jgi:hypothetical protein
LSLLLLLLLLVMVVGLPLDILFVFCERVRAILLLL